jgi:hypothetical protein
MSDVISQRVIGPRAYSIVNNLLAATRNFMQNHHGSTSCRPSPCHPVTEDPRGHEVADWRDPMATNDLING